MIHPNYLPVTRIMFVLTKLPEYEAQEYVAKTLKIILIYSPMHSQLEFDWLNILFCILVFLREILHKKNSIIDAVIQSR